MSRMTFDVQLFADQNMGSAQKNLRRQVPLRLIAKRARDDKRLEGEFLYPRRHIPEASFALYEESRSFLYSKAHHVSSRVYSARDGAFEQFRPYLQVRPIGPVASCRPRSCIERARPSQFCLLDPFGGPMIPLIEVNPNATIQTSRVSPCADRRRVPCKSGPSLSTSRVG